MQAMVDRTDRGAMAARTATGAARRIADLEAALDALRSDRPVAFPTETVWGLAVPARSRPAVAALLRWKGRDEGRPMAVMVSRPDALEAAGIVLPALGHRLAEAFWPGPLTLVVADGPGFAPGIARADGALGVRCSPHPVAVALAAAAEEAGLGPLTATSLNRSGEAPARTIAEARVMWAPAESPDSPYGLAVSGLDAFGAAPSTVLDLTTGPARVLRWGAIDAGSLARFAGAIDLENALARPDRPGSTPQPHRQGDRPR